MTHLDEGTIVSLRDREWAPDETHGHLETCAGCEAALREAEQRAVQIERALASLESPELDLEAARARIRARVDARTERSMRAGARWWTGHLGRAAAVLLVVTGAVSALPGSPVRNWIAGPAEPVHMVPAAATETFQEAATSGVAVPVPAGGIRVVVTSLGPIGPLEVVWIDEATARVDAPAGSRFTYGEGRVEAMVAGGPVRIELPRAGATVAIEVDGQPYLTRSGGQLQVTGPVGERSEAGILFTVP
jgi:hypothetical protein